MTRYDDLDEPGGGVSLSGHALPGQPVPAQSGPPGDSDWQSSSYGDDGRYPGEPYLSEPYSAEPDTGEPDTGGWTGGWRAYRSGRAAGQASRSGGSGGWRRDQHTAWSARFLHPSRHTLLGAAAVVAMFAVVATSLVAYAQYRGVVDSIHRENVTAAMLGNRPPFTAGLNILVIGSDSRAGTGTKFGADIVGSRSDTSMVLHVAPGHARADIISFPRDSMVPILSCANDGQGHSGQQAQPGQLERLNATFSFGGAPCLWKTLEQETGIRIQHFVEVNFAGFQSIINDVGGVPVCLPFAINNAQSRLNLPAGKQVVNGAQALAFVRLRENIGEGSDTQRIQRQQYFLAAVMQKLKATNVLTQPSKIYSVVRDAAKSLTTDSGLDLTTMLRIADSMKSLNSSSVQFITVPVVPYAGDPAAELSWEQPQADRLFKAIEADRNLPTVAKGKRATTVKVPTVSPAKVDVQVLNGSGAAGVATSAATALTGQGFKVTGQGNAANFNFTSNVIEYASASQLPAVNTLKTAVGSVAVQQDAALGSGPITLILGSSYNGLKAAGTAQGSAKKSAAQKLGNLAKNYGGITASTNICSDSAAFAGPDTPLPGG
ncbi:MAG TPA: LCP family protein [Streptosporangiaceae bacterium]|nr:LCP family protein [Streptosporangiaceae bacterium]